MKIDFTKNENHTGEITVTVEPSDYNEKLESELKKLQKTVTIRGFRKGKTPKSMIKKLHGRNLLAEIVSDKINTEVDKYLREEGEKNEFIGAPISAESQEKIDFDPDSTQNYVFRFDIGWLPELEIKGLDETYHYYDIQVDETAVEERLEMMRKYSGSHQDVTGPFEENDHLTFNARELEDGKVKKDGLETTFDILLGDIRDEETKKKVMESKVGEKLQFYIYKISDNPDEDFVRKYLMKLEEEDKDLEVNAEFEGEVVDAHRHVPAELTEEFLEKSFGPDVKTQEEALEKIREDMKQIFSREADRMLFKEMRKRIAEETQIEFPDEYMKRWLLHTSDPEKNISFTEISKDYDTYLREDLKWSVLTEKWARKYEIDVTPDEIKTRVINDVYSYLASQVQDPKMIIEVAQNMLNDASQVEQYRRMILDDKVFSKLKESIELDRESISMDDFEKVLEDKREERYGDASGEEE